jgi:carboxypeptidase Taq
MSDSYKEFSDHCYKMKQIQNIEGLLSWDQEVLMPKAAVAQRADQISYLQTHLHEIKLAPQFNEIVENLWAKRDELEPWQKRSVELRRKDIRLSSKIPSELVDELARETVNAQEVWKAARAKSDFKMFVPALKRMFALMKKRATYLVEGGQEPYEVLLDTFEPDLKLSDARHLLEDFRKQLVPIVAGILENLKSKPAVRSDLFAMSRAVQEVLNRRVLDWMGFDMDAGRIDPSTHPFCSGTAYDVRLTTRFDEKDFTSSLFSVLHEGGHGIYEQSLGRVIWKELQSAASFGLHESQSRFWENMIGRSRSFCHKLVEKMNEWKIPFEGTGEDLYHFVNRVAPTFIRVESDEVTYNLHILIRFELEQALFAGDLSVDDLAAAWNEKYKSYLGIDVPNDAQGVLQDIHWSFGLYGYFPTYSFGNLISVQLLDTMNKKLSVEKIIASGDLHSIKEWLVENVHSKGAFKSTWELVRSVTGTPPSATPFINYLKQKFI